MIHYLKGDATHPQAAGPKLIVHICNDVGGWGKGFVMALSKKWSAPEADYRAHYKNRNQPDGDFKLGAVRFVPVTRDITVANMVAQHGLSAHNGVPPIRYDALEMCLKKVNAYCLSGGHSIHMPRIGCGLAGGKWDEVEAIIVRVLSDLDVYVYDFA